MGETNTGLRALLTSPAIYEAVQRLMGAEQGRRAFVATYMAPKAGDRILDVGCGPAELLRYLPDVTYVGFDPNPAYIDRAKQRFGDRATFFARRYEPADAATLPAFDIALLRAVLHHLDDEEARELLGLLHKSLKPGGRLVTLDNVFVPDQNPIARLLISMDRGRNVRSPAGYRALAEGLFDVVGTVVHKTFPPYTYYIMTASRGP
jgi:SAM-dependent methyltransferase